MSDNGENQTIADDKATPENKKKETKSPKDKADPKKKSLQAAVPKQSVRPRSSSILAILALLIAIASIAGSYILWRQLKDAQLAQANSDAQTKSSIGAIKPEVSTLQTKLDSLETQLDPKLQDIASKQQLLQESLQSLQVELGKEQSDDWVLAETEYLMRIANNRLILEHDVNTALAALSIADTRLRDIGNPALIDVRRQLSDEITALEAVETPDITGMALTLHSLQERVTLLPLKGESNAEKQQNSNHHTQDTMNSGETSGWRKILSEIWTALKSLVTISHVNEDDSALIPPDQRAFLRQNLRLQLETARLALFRNDDLSYHASLDTANEWLTRYFNTDAGSTASMQDAIERLNETKLDAPLPDISGSLNSLREILAQKSVHVIKQKRPSPLVAPATSASEGETGSTETGSAASASGTGKAVGSGQKADGGISP